MKIKNIKFILFALILALPFSACQNWSKTAKAQQLEPVPVHWQVL